MPNQASIDSSQYAIRIPCSPAKTDLRRNGTALHFQTEKSLRDLRIGYYRVFLVLGEHFMKICRAIQSFALSIMPPLAVLAVPASALAAEPLRMVVGTMSYPFEAFDANGQLTGGLFKDFAEQLARELGTSADFVRLPRRRVEPSLIAGETDLSCYDSPDWSENPKLLLWSIPTLKQVERVLVLKAKQPPKKIPDDFVGQRVSTRLGYHYAAIQPLFDAGQAYRIDETKTAFMIKAVETGYTDMLISSEGEIEGYFQAQPEARKRFAISAQPFSTVPTRCAVSPKSRWSLEKIDKALATMLKRGDMDRMSRHYGLSMR